MINLLKNKRFFFLLAITIISHLSAKPIKSISYWENLFNSELEKNYKMDIALSKSNDSWSFYKLGGSIDAYTAMYRASGNIKYLDVALGLVVNMINSATPSHKIKNSQYKDKYLGWANHSHEVKKDDGKEYQLFEAFCWRYVAVLLETMKQSGASNFPKYSATYNKILNFIEVNLFDKWMSRGSQNIYTISTNMSSHWAVISLNLWEITKENKYAVVFNKFNEQMRKQLTEVPSQKTYIWNEFWDTRYVKHNHGHDVSHANAEVDYIIDAYQHNIFFTQKDITFLINTFNHIWKKDGTSSYYLDGTGNGGGRFVDGFMKLGRFNDKLQKRIEKYTVTNETVYYRKIYFYANVALNAYYLNNKNKLFAE